MADDKKKTFELATERRRQPRIECDEKVEFDTPSRQANRGFVKRMNGSGCLLVSMERLTIDSEILIHLVLSIADEKMEIEVAGKVVNVDRTVEAPFKGFGIAFSSANSTQVMRAINEVVQSRLGIVPKAPIHVEPTRTENEAAEPSAPPVLPPIELPAQIKSLPSKPPSQSAPAESSAKPTTSRRPAFIAFAIVVFAAGGSWIYNSLSSNAWKEELSAIIPIEQSKKVEYDLYIVVDPKWLGTWNRDDKAKKIIEFAKAMGKYNIHGAHFLDGEKRVVADVLLCDGDTTTPPRVTWRLPPESIAF